MQTSSADKTPAGKVPTIAIVGGGTAGWMAAAALSKALPKEHYSILLIESSEIGTVGVGEATIPPILTFNKLLGIDTKELLKETKGTFKLGIEFINWANQGDSYYHPFGTYGPDSYGMPFHQLWRMAYSQGLAKRLEAYSINAQMAMQKKFSEPKNIPNSPLASINYAFHFDASLYAQFLRGYSELRGVRRIEAKIASASTDSDTGNISTLHLEDHEDIQADFFIDCSGFKGILIEQTLKTGYEDWSKYLPCNSAKAVASEKQPVPASHTKAIAHGFGWQWRIPLQHRTGNGFVYSNAFCSDQTAEDILLSNLETKVLGEAKQLRFTSGKRKKIWNKNCLSLGLASGFLEPLESTSIHLVQSALSKFLGIFPHFEQCEVERNRFNQMMDQEISSIRDFIILHYKATNREDTEFWRYCKNMEIPESLQQKIDLYRSSGYLFRDGAELFSENSWLSVMEGQGIYPERQSPFCKTVSVEQAAAALRQVEEVVAACVKATQGHDKYIAAI
ncbi:tryptophan 7-halogenase [Saccharophagus sp. K07]|jgi:tryptophan halogenase|uniref:tryptophan halogenase family protein n=1 Tax=Saccharophagus sp. K07 TaxID=2283636 RepID=UPI001652700B|nr:tryptophan halogenase family protein [Saccharophagus sp. K07]MBC6905385.1 tryptophan 7-halogenase [Saccharophagus sp. K07]